MPSPFAMKQFRYVDHTSTYPTAYTAGNNATWTNADNLRVFDIELDLKENAEQDKTIQTGHHGHPAPIFLDNSGSTVKFSCYLEGGTGTTTAGHIATLVGRALGGLRSPNAATGTAEAGSAIDFVNETGHSKVVGEAVLVGARDDGGGDGKLAAIKTIDTADKYSFFMALPAAPLTTADELHYGHTAYMDASSENYLSFFLIGHYAGSGASDDPDQLNLSGCSCAAIEFSGMRAGESPKVTMTWNIGRWRNEPYATTAAIDHDATPVGGDPAGNLAIGALLVGDLSSYTRSTVQGGDVEVAPNITIEKIEDPNDDNQCGGWVSLPSETGPTCSITRYWGDMPGLRNDFTAGTGKQVLIQWGNTQTGCVGIFLPRAYLTAAPERIEFSRSMALKLQFHGDRGRATDLSTDDLKLQDSPLMVYFH
jgi:hypothetical protein